MSQYEISLKVNHSLLRNAFENFETNPHAETYAELKRRMEAYKNAQRSVRGALVEFLDA